MAENCGRQGDSCASALQDAGARAKSKNKKKKKRRKHSGPKAEKEQESKDDSPGSDQEYMDCSESTSPESHKDELTKAKPPETKEPQQKDDEKGKRNDSERKVESCPVKKVEKSEEEEPMDCEDASTHGLDPPSKGNQLPPNSEDLQEKSDERFAAQTDKKHKNGDGMDPVGPQKDQHFKDGADNATSAGKSRKRNKKSRWDQGPPPDSEAANVKEEQGNQQVSPTSSAQDEGMDFSEGPAKSPVVASKDEERDPSQKEQHAEPVEPQKDQRFTDDADTATSSGRSRKHKKKKRRRQKSPDGEAANVTEEQGNQQVSATSSAQDEGMDASKGHVKPSVVASKDKERDPSRRDQRSEQLHKHDPTQREPMGRGKERTDYHDSRGGHQHDKRGRWDSGRRDRQDHSNQDHRRGEAHHPQRGNRRRDDQEQFQRGPRGPQQDRDYGRHGADGNWREGNQRPRRRSEERPKYTVGRAPDGKETFAFFFRSSSPFSQWHFCNFTVEGVRYVCAEQFMMHQKAILFGDEEVARLILQSDDPREQKQLGREVRDFDEGVWSKHCYDIVSEGNLAKFRQNDHLREVLLETDGMTLVEASPYDQIWGIGLDAEDPRAVNRRQWKGENLLGQVLTGVREQIIREGGKTMDRGGTRGVKDREHAEGREEHGKESTTVHPVKLDRNFERRHGGASQVTNDKVLEATDEDDSGEKFHFFSYKRDPFYCSQHHCRFEVEGNTFSSAEQYMLYHKAMFTGCEDAAQQILEEEDMNKQKKLSKKGKKNMEEWNKSRLQAVMFDGNMAKFSQNPELRELLLETDGKTLALTDQTNDDFWGIGLDATDPRARKKDQWKGKNLLGDILTRVRDKILQDRRDEQAGETETSTAAPKQSGNS